jgi:hypothetical protein
VLNFLHLQKKEPLGGAAIEAARVSIEGLAGAKLRRAALAASLGSSTLLLQKILSKRIRNVPSLVMRQLAQHLNIATRTLEDLLGPRIAGAISYKSTDKPNVPTVESWEEAVQALPVDETEKKRLVSLQEREPA